ncbi:MAG TPA: hypothetical protein ENJ95_09965 [Bacteroidetes bacterium]|nr:hypothetical protein [Bacteroidota bacterium]
MKHTYLLLFILSMAACKGKQPIAANKMEKTQKQAPLPKPEIPPTSESALELRNKVRNTFRMELPNTYPTQKGDKQATLSYTFKVLEKNGQISWVFKEKLYDETDKLYGGADYILPWQAVDLGSIKIVGDEAGNKIGIRIKPKAGQSFTFNPYSNEPDSQVGEVLLGWYDPVQTATLSRAVVYMHQLAGKMGEFEKPEFERMRK